MNTEELRAIIWDDLFRGKRARTVDEIAALTQHDAIEVRAAVEHEWFSMNDDRVAVAMARPATRIADFRSNV